MRLRLELRQTRLLQADIVLIVEIINPENGIAPLQQFEREYVSDKSCGAGN